MQIILPVYFLLVIVMMLPFINNVVGMAGVLLLSAFLSALIVVNILGWWFGLILFLIYISGLLVLFGYMLALTPNRYGGDFLQVVKVFMMVLFFIVILLFLFKNKSIGLLELSTLEFEWSIIELFGDSNMKTYWIMCLILLLTLVIVVKLTYKSPSPLRPFL